MAEILEEDLKGGERKAYLPRLVHLFEKPLANIRGTAYVALHGSRSTEMVTFFLFFAETYGQYWWFYCIPKVHRVFELPEEEQKPFVAEWVKLIGNDEVSLDARKEACTKYGKDVMLY